MRMRLLLGVAVCATLAVAVHSQSTGPQGIGPLNDKSRQVVDKVIAALGGDRFLHMRSRYEVGHTYGFFHDLLSGPEIVHAYFEYADSGNANDLAVRERQMLGKKQDYSYLYLPDRAWDITFRGARPVSDETWERYHRATYYDILYILRCRLAEPGLQFDYVGSDVYLSQHVEILDVTDAANTTVRVYLDHNTMLPLHESYQWMDEKTRERNDEAAEYDKYRNADGVMWPFVVERERNGYKISQIFAESVRIDQPLPPNIFELPAGAKILNKPR